jgi:YYY domain-containing protein
MVDSENISPSQQTESTESTIEASVRRPKPVPETIANPTTAEEERSSKKRRADVSLLLLGVLLIGAFFRFFNINWDEGEHLHPDERYMTMVTGAIRSPGSSDTFQNPPAGCTSWGGYFDSYCSPLNPYNHQGYGSYAYGTFPLFTARIAGEILNTACADPANPSNAPPAFVRSLLSLLFSDAEDCVGARFTDYGHVHLLGRMLSGLADLGTLVLLFLIGRRLYGQWVGLLAAALYALAALPIQQSHFYTVDSFAGFFIAVAGYFTVRAAQDGHWLDFGLAGVTLGFGLASKVSVWPFAAVIVLAALIYYVRSRSALSTEFPEQGQAAGQPSQLLDWLMVLLLVIFFFLIAVIALFGIWSAVKIAFFFAIAVLFSGGLAFYVFRPWDTHAPPSNTNRKPIGVDGALLRVVVAGIFAFLAFRVAQPYAFVGTNFDVAKWETAEYDVLRANVPDLWYTLDEKLPTPIRSLLLPDPRFISTLGSVNRQLTGEADVPWGHQWTNRLPFVFPWVNMVFWGMGLALGLISWTGWAFAGWEIWRGRRRTQHLIPWTWVAILFFYQGTQWVKSIRYLLPVYPFLILLGAWLLVTLWRRAGEQTSGLRAHRLSSVGYRIPLVIALIGTFLWAWAFTRIYTQPVTRNAASRWMVENIPPAAVLHYRVDGAARSQFLRYPPTYVYADTGLAHITSFALPEDGTVTGITFTHLSDPDKDAAPENFQVVLATDVDGQDILARSERSFNLETAKHSLGDKQDFDLGRAQLQGGQVYYVLTRATEGAPIRLDTTVIANEYPDDSLPTRVDGMDPFGTMYRGLESSGDGKTHWDLNQDSSKLGQALEWLDEADIIALSSNRGYASIPRLPSRYPMAIEYYRKLFAEELGFELIATFTSYPSIGPLQFPDQETPFTPHAPSLVRDELGSISVQLPPAEEAFSVYDHPQVFLFRKTDGYSRQAVENALADAAQRETVWMKPVDATLAPTALMHTEDELQVQRSGGTWTDIFDAQGWLNRSPVLSVLAWFLLIQALGLIAFPVLFVAAPGLPDRGWPLAKTLGLLLLAFLVWLPASSSAGWASGSPLLTYSRLLIFVVFLALAICGAALALWQRSKIAAFIARERRALLASEALFLGMFLLFLLIRYGNPDLWHPVMGGERPMDFAYLNAVLKSSNFPPYDPWFSGGYLNYYYFGFVIVGTPMKLLGILPDIAYNLALPTLFALTGVGAFSVAYNVVARWQTGRIDKDETGFTGGGAGIQATRGAWRRGSKAKYAIYAGLIAALFVAVLGNLGEIGLVSSGLQELGSRDFDFQSTIPGLQPLVVSLRGLVKHALGGEPMPWRPEWPYWNASRSIPHPDTEAPPITEFPFFSFLYSDLHAHLLVLPLTLLALAFMLNWVIDRGFWNVSGTKTSTQRRRWFSIGLGLVLPGIVIGAMRPTNTWDYVTYLAMVPLALLVGFFVHRARSGKQGLRFETVRSGTVAIGGRFAAVAAVSYLLFLPYITGYATGSTGFDFWQGSRTPLWAYFGVHGLFLFPIVTWLVLNQPWRRTGRSEATRSTLIEKPEQSERVSGGAAWLVVAIVLIGLATLLALLAGYQIAIVVLPLGFLAFLTLLQPRTRPVERMVALIAGVALGLTLLVEILVLNQGDVGRMNTVFKFYLQAWVLLAIAAAVSIIWVKRLFWGGSLSLAPSSRDLAGPVEPTTEMGQPSANADHESAGTHADAEDTLRTAWRGWKIILALLVGLAALYPILATRAKINDRWDRSVGPGLDSLEWMKSVSDTQFGPGAPEGLTFPLLWDYQALMWLRENVEGSPVVAEGAKAPPYRSLRARVATYTGLPIIIGYPWHEKQQRSFVKTDLVDRRERDVNVLFDTTDPWLADEILRRYDVEYVYLGDLERAHYLPEGIEKFAKMVDMGLLQPVYANEGVSIYAVVR